MCFLQPCDDPPRADGVGSRPWEAFRRVLEDLGEHSDETQSVIPSEQWKQWFLGLDERVPFSPTDAADLERSLWQIMEKVTCGKPSYTFTPREYGWEHHDREMWQSRHRPPPITQLQLAKWRQWRPAQLRDLEPTTQRALEEKLRQHWSNRLISHLAPHASDIPAMAAVMGDGNDHEEFLHLLGDARFSTLRQRCLALEKLKKHGGLQIPWTEKSVRSLLSNLHKEECTPNYIQQVWDTLKWFSTKFQTLDVTATHRLASKKKWLQETLVSTASTPQRKAVVPAKEVILALEQGAAAGGAEIAREAIDAFILGMVRFQVGSSARFNDLQHTSPSTMKVTSNTIEMMAWQTKTASAFRIKKNPVPLIAPKLSLSGVDWWTEWSKTLTLLSSLERFQDMDYLIPTLSKDFQGVIPRPSTSDRGLRWLKEALVRQGVDQDLVTPLTWHSFRVFIPDCAYQLGIPRAQRQYLGNWQTEPTADIYTREKRNVVVDIWSRVLGKIQEVDLEPGRMAREDLAHPDWDDKPLDKPGDTESVVDSNVLELVQSDAETGLIESEGGPNSASTQHTSSSRRTRAAAKSSELLRPLFQEIFADEVAPPVGPLIVVALLRKTGNPPKRKLHLLDRDGRAVGCGWSPDLTKVSSMTKDDYDSEAADLLLHCSRCFHRFRLPSDWGVQDAPAHAVDSDSSVARQQPPRELGFEADHNGFTAASSGFAAMKLFQGSDALLRCQYKFCSKGEIGFIHSKYIISALPEEGERPIKTRKKITVDGWEKEEEEEERAAPTTRRQLERLHLVFRNTLLMCLAAFPQFPQFNLTKEDLDSFYDWFYGPELNRRKRPTGATGDCRWRGLGICLPLASNAPWLTPALLGVLLALGTPLSWKKTVLSEINTWLGFVINPSGPFVQMAKEKHVAVLKLLKELEEGKAFSLKAIEKALGKIQWATATCPMAKPFLQPFWAWKSAVKTAGVPGKLVRCLAVLLSQLFSKQFPQMSPFSPWSSWTGASDASAEKEGESWIGGWLTDSPEPSKDKVLWFQYKVCQEHHPWAFKKNDPQKRIAALELYGTLFLALMLMAQNPSTPCRLHIPLVSDNQGNVYSILNNATRKMPTAVILMELVYQLYQAGHMLAPAHSRRDDNQWADELTHPNPKGFDPALRTTQSPDAGRRVSGSKEEPKEPEVKAPSKTRAKMSRSGSQVKKQEPEQKSDPFADLKTAFEPVKEKSKTFNLKSCVTRTGTVLMNMLERLLETTDIDATDVESDMTLLEFACTTGNLGLAKLCYRRGAKLMAISKRGETAFNIVTKNRRYDIMEFLHIYGVRINCADAEGRTALHVAAQNNDVDGICRLLEWGADVNICDHKKRTPIHLAAMGGHTQATMLLLEVGADMNAKDVREYTAMAHAEANNHFKLMDRLVQLGAKGHGLHHSNSLATSKSTTSLHGGTALAVPAGMLKSSSLGRIGKVVVHGMPGPIVPQLQEFLTQDPQIVHPHQDIATAMKGAEGYPPMVVKMISDNLAICLADYKEERHEFQASVASMAEQIIASIKVSIEAKIKEAEEKLAKADADKASREAAMEELRRGEETKKSAEDKVAANVAAKQEVSTAEDELKKAMQALKAAEKEQKSGDAKSVADEAKKSKLENAINSVFVPCKEGALEKAAITKGISELQKLGKEYDFDNALLTSLPSALQKEPASRGTFDNVVVNNVEEELQKRLTSLKEELAKAAPDREERASKVASCAAAVEAGKMKLDSLEKACKDALAAMKEADGKAKAASKALKAFGPEMKATGKALKDAKDSLESFTTGAMTSFTELLARTKPAPEPEVAEAPAEAEAAS
eukprot:symbB.v1.2.001939.t1/scaffold55.1/size374282/21